MMFFEVLITILFVFVVIGTIVEAIGYIKEVYFD